MILGSLFALAMAQRSVEEILSIASQANIDNNVILEETTYRDGFKEYPKNPRIREKYAEHLLKVGKYQEIIDLELTDEEKIKKDDLLRYIMVIQYKAYSEIEKLATISPRNFEVIIVVAKIKLEKKDINQYQKYIRIAERLSPKDRRVSLLKAIYSAYVGNYEDAVVYYRAGGDSKTALNIEDALRSYRAIKNGNKSSTDRLKDYKKVYDTVFSHYNGEFIEPNAYKKLLVMILTSIVEVGCIVEDGSVLVYATRLVDLEKTTDTCYLQIKAAIQVKNLQSASLYLKEYASFFRPNILKSLQSMYDDKLKQKSREDEQNRRANEEKQKNTYGGNQGNRTYSNLKNEGRAGTDFLGYYKTLGVNNKSTEEQIKKAYRKVYSKANKNKDKEKREEDLKVVNKAYEVLISASKKDIYDRGFDPESPEAQSQSFYSQQKDHHGYYQDIDMNDIFNAFFGGGGRRGNNSFGNGRYSYSYSYVL